MRAFRSNTVWRIVVVRVMSTLARIKQRKREECFAKVGEHAMLSLQPRRLGVDKIVDKGR